MNPRNKKRIAEQAKAARRSRKKVFAGSSASEQKGAEDALKESEWLNKQIIESSVDCIKILDVEGRLLFISQGGQNLLEIEDVGPYLGKSWTDFWKGAHYRAACEAVSRAARGSSTGFEAFCPTSKGAPKWWDVKITPIRGHDGKVKRLLSISRDITEHKQAEEALRESEAKWRSLTENSPDTIVTVDINGTIQFINRTVEKVSGDADVPGTSVYEYVPPEHVDIVKNALGRVFDTGIPEIYQTSARNLEGTIVGWYETHVGPVFDGDTIIAATLAARDITDRKRTEDALKAHIRRDELILHTTHDGFWIYEPDGGLRDVNDAYCRMVGYSRQELLTMNIADVEANENPQEVQAHIKNIIETGYGCFETRHRRKDGSLIYLEVSSSAAELDGERFFFTFFRDISERKQAEEALQTQMQRNELILRTTRDGFCICGPVGDFRDVNDAYCRMLDYSREELLTMNITDVEANEKPEDTRAHIDHTIEKGYTHFETRHHRKDGSFVYLDISSTPAELDGEWFFFAFVRDITDRKRAMEDIARLAKFPSENPNPVLRVAADGVVLYGNEASLPILDFWQCRQSDRLTGMWYELLCEVLGEGKPQEAEVRCNDNIYLLIFAPVEDAGFVNVYGLDITERKRAEDSLRESEKKYRIVTETSVDTIYQLDSAGNITFMNSAGADMYGYDLEEIIGMNFSSLMTEERLPEGYQFVQKVLSGQSVQGEIYVKHKKGHEFPVYFSMAPVVDQGNVVGLAGVSRDITERKQAEQQLLEYQAQLKSLASQLSVTEERERHRLATEMHDRVGQSLVFSKMKLEFLRESVSSSELVESLDEVCEFLGQTIQEAMTVMFDMSSPVLYELGFEVAVAGWLADEIRNRHGIETIFENDDRTKPLTDDIRAVLFHSVRELLSNVVKHAQAKIVKVSICRDDGDIRVIIEDDGVGFDPAEVKSKAPQKAKFGIFSIRERLEQLGGHIEIESEPGQGSKITMTAPLKNKDKADGV